MGYYSFLTYGYSDDLRLDKNKLKEIEKFFKSDNDDIYGFYGVEFKTDPFSIFLDEYNAKFYDDELFARKLSTAIIKGEVYLVFNGEDGISWQIICRPNAIETYDSYFLSNKEAGLIALYRQNRKFAKSVNKLYKEFRKGKNNV